MRDCWNMYSIRAKEVVITRGSSTDLFVNKEKEMQYIGMLKAYMVAIMWMVLSAYVPVVMAEPTPVFEYIVTWSANTEADMAGYILETSNNGKDGWTIVNDNIPFGTNKYTARFTQNIKWFRVSSFDKSKNISAPSTPMRGAYVVDAIQPTPPNVESVVVTPVEEVVTAPDMSNVKLTVSGRAMTLQWDAKNAETQIWMANSAQASTLITTVGSNGTNITVTATIAGWHCFQLRHKQNSVLGNWANANPANPNDISFCTSVQ